MSHGDAMRLGIILFIPFMVGLTFSTRIGVSTGGYTARSPYLYAPCTENIHLADKQELEFRWKPARLYGVRGYELRLYKGFQTFQDGLLMSEYIRGRRRSFSLPVALFKDNKIFSWELTEVYIDGRKSDRGYCSFEIQEE